LRLSGAVKEQHIRQPTDGGDRLEITGAST
jgi:hypothetical protein